MAIYVALALAVTVALLYGWLQTGDNSYRIDAVKRFLWGIPYFLVMFAVGTAFGIILILTWILDVLWQLLTGRDGITSRTPLQRLWAWRDHNTRYLVYNEGNGFKLFP